MHQLQPPSADGHTCLPSSSFHGQLLHRRPLQRLHRHHAPADTPHQHCHRSVKARMRRREPIIAPYIETGRIGPEGEPEGVDLYGHLLRNRIIYIGTRITDELAVRIVASLLALEAINDKEDIRFYINSTGGAPYHVVSILDTIRAIKPQVSTVSLGLSASTATLLLAAGAKGKRYSMPSARIMMHQPIGGCMGSADEVNIQATELNRTMKVLHQFYHEFTGLPIERVEEETDRDNFVSPQTAIELGLIDAII